MVIVCHFPARFTALEKTIVTLGIKEPFLVKSRLLKAMVHIGRDNKIILVFYQILKVLHKPALVFHVTVDVDIS